MASISASMKCFFKDEVGVTAIEYALIASLIAIVIITAVVLIGTNLNAIFSQVAGCIITPSGCP